MRIDGTHRPWGIATAGLAIVAGAVFFAAQPAGGARGGSGIGLAFGAAGYALMLYAGLLGARKRVPTWRLGRAQAWMRGHLWLGALSLLLILFHSGFRFSGPLATALMVLSFVVVGSGIVGAALQHFLPRLITARVPLETIYQEIPNVRAQLREEADRLAVSICGPWEGALEADGPVQSGQVELEHDARGRFRVVYLAKIRPYLTDPDAPEMEIANPDRSGALFGALRRVLDAAAHEVLDDLENICGEEQQLSRQIRMHRWLHAWLLVHVPLSILLLLLATIHAVVALRY